MEQRGETPRERPTLGIRRLLTASSRLRIQIPPETHRTITRRQSTGHHPRHRRRRRKHDKEELPTVFGNNLNKQELNNGLQPDAIAYITA
jgi:hypothetical protein